MGWEMARTGSGSYPMTGFGTSDVKPSDSAN